MRICNVWFYIDPSGSIILHFIKILEVSISHKYQLVAKMPQVQRTLGYIYYF